MQKIKHIGTISIPVSKIRESDLGIRKHYDDEQTNELGQSISDMGTIYPLIVTRAADGEYELIIGSRRLRAAKKFKLDKIPAVVISNIDGRSQLELMLAENLHRQDLTVFEEAWAILKLINDFKVSVKQVAKIISKDETFVTRRLQLLSLPRKVQELVNEKQFSLANISVLANLATPELQLEYATKAAQYGLDRDELAVLIHEELKRGGPQQHKLQRTRIMHNGRPAWRKISLQVSSFSNWLQRTLPSGVKMDIEDMRAVRSSLYSLKKAVSSSLDNLEGAGR